ncbi:hypothetical protein C943_01709 [Mariniradius saccharolyticus AK6]|uniref:Uncharacterized protein n=1 Tax=Mariniradius saccharolyticus AK6 TaxID=1239962 RepID=M7XAQ3_9BACT|nr:hypothetical protein C943_01709 [Mariniradius saccharolyticus AK6]
MLVLSRLSIKREAEADLNSSLLNPSRKPGLVTETQGCGELGDEISEFRNN